MLCEYATRSLSRCREGEKFDKLDKVQSSGGIYTCWESNPGCPTREAGALPSALHVDDDVLGSRECEKLGRFQFLEIYVRAGN